MNRATWSSRQTPRARDQSHNEDLEEEQNILNYWVPQVSKHDILKVQIVVHGAVGFVVKMVGFRHFPFLTQPQDRRFLLYLISDFSWFIVTSTIVAVTLLFFHSTSPFSTIRHKLPKRISPSGSSPRQETNFPSASLRLSRTALGTCVVRASASFSSPATVHNPIFPYTSTSAHLSISEHVCDLSVQFLDEASWNVRRDHEDVVKQLRV